MQIIIKCIQDYLLEPFQSFYGMQVIMPQIFLLMSVFLLFERVSVIPHSACTFELDECRTFYLRVREACSLLTAAIQLGQDVTRVDQEVPGVGITEVTFFLLPMFKVIGDLRQLTAC